MQLRTIHPVAPAVNHGQSEEERRGDNSRLYPSVGMGRKRDAWVSSYLTCSIASDIEYITQMPHCTILWSFIEIAGSKEALVIAHVLVRRPRDS